MDGYGYQAPGLLTMLRRHGVSSGLVVDLGCGSGIWAQELASAGYDVLGVDASDAMIELARARAPAARLVTASFLSVELPRCEAVTAIGECFNYAFDPGMRRGRRALPGLFRRIHRALRPGGVLIFDTAAPGLVPAGQTRRSYSDGGDWAVLLEAAEDRGRRLLTRRITVFRRVGGGDLDLYRRTDETHRLRLYERERVTADLEGAGFRVRVLGGYGRLQMLPGRVGFLAVKPR